MLYLFRELAVAGFSKDQVKERVAPLRSILSGHQLGLADIGALAN